MSGVKYFLPPMAQQLASSNIAGVGKGDQDRRRERGGIENATGGLFEQRNQGIADCNSCRRSSNT